MSLHNPVVKKVKSISPVWIVPAVALMIALWLVIKARLEHGALVEIRFENATDIIPGQTQVRLNDVKVGMVKDVRLSRDLKYVRVFAQLDREVTEHLSENTRFWVVTPRIGVTGVSNLGTLINGVFIRMDPGDPGAYQTDFTGLSESPLFESGEPGKQYILQADELGSFDVGSPIYYRKIKVGEVISYKLSESRNSVDINIFVREPYDELVQTRSRFWNVSGVDVSVGANGLKAHVESLAALISGGIAFENVTGFDGAEMAKGGDQFYLYPDRDSVLEGRFNIKYYYVLKFGGSVRGLSVGAPVEFRGIRVGEVVDVELNSSDNAEKVLHVYISIEPQRLSPDDEPTRDQVDNRLEQMVAQGLRAQMRTGNLLTGSRFIDLSFFEGKGSAQFIQADTISEIPTVEDSADLLVKQASDVMHNISQIPFDHIGTDLSESLSSIKHILKEFEHANTAAKFDGVVENMDKTLVNANKALAQLDATLASLDQTIAPDSELKYELTEMLQAVADAADSLQLFIDELNRHPRALLSGADKDE